MRHQYWFCIKVDLLTLKKKKLPKKLKLNATKVNKTRHFHIEYLTIREVQCALNRCSFTSDYEVWVSKFEFEKII